MIKGQRVCKGRREGQQLNGGLMGRGVKEGRRA